MFCERDHREGHGLTLMTEDDLILALAKMLPWRFRMRQLKAALRKLQQGNNIAVKRISATGCDIRTAL